MKSDLFKSILAKLSAMATMLQSYRKGSTKDKDTSKDSKEYKDMKVGLPSMLLLSLSCLFFVFSLLNDTAPDNFLTPHPGHCSGATVNDQWF